MKLIYRFKTRQHWKYKKSLCVAGRLYLDELLLGERVYIKSLSEDKWKDFDGTAVCFLCHFHSLCNEMNYFSALLQQEKVTQLEITDLDFCFFPVGDRAVFDFVSLLSSAETANGLGYAAGDSTLPRQVSAWVCRKKMAKFQHVQQVSLECQRYATIYRDKQRAINSMLRYNFYAEPVTNTEDSLGLDRLINQADNKAVCDFIALAKLILEKLAQQAQSKHQQICNKVANKARRKITIKPSN